MNLLKETLEDIKESGHAIEDIVFIGGEDSGYCCEWADFKVIADINYNSGFGAQEIASDLVIVFSDGSKMWRHEYDGSECWKYSKPFKMPKNKKQLLKVMRGGMWEDLEEIHTDA